MVRDVVARHRQGQDLVSFRDAVRQQVEIVRPFACSVDLGSCRLEGDDLAKASEFGLFIYSKGEKRRFLSGFGGQGGKRATSLSP